MKSFKQHHDFLLQQKTGFEVFQATAFFPVIHTRTISTRLLFLGYWLIKRGIKKVQYTLSIFDGKGKKLIEEMGNIDKAKAYEFLIHDLFEDDETFFEGSAEITFHSKEDLVFPYPAVVVNYFGPKFSSFVHTAQRRFIHEEDEKSSMQKTAQGGLNFHQSDEQTPFVWVINGQKPIESKILDIDILYLDGSQNYCSMILNMNPFETKRITFPFFANTLATVKLHLPLEKIFGRVIAGHFSSTNQSLSITHSYQDVSKQNELWAVPQGYMGASLMVPLFPKPYETKIYFYPLYAKKPFDLFLEIYNPQGKKLHSESLGKIQGTDYIQIDLTKYQTKKEMLFAKILAKGEKKIPARIKIALDVFPKQGLGCNICTNLKPPSKELENKKGSFRWVPFFADQPEPVVTISHYTNQENYDKMAEVEITFYRKQDQRTLKETLQLAVNTSAVITLTKKLKRFFKNEAGWITFQSENPNIHTFYFSLNENHVGGDHGF